MVKHITLSLISLILLWGSLALRLCRWWNMLFNRASTSVSSVFSRMSSSNESKPFAFIPICSGRKQAKNELMHLYRFTFFRNKCLNKSPNPCKCIQNVLFFEVNGLQHGQLQEVHIVYMASNYIHHWQHSIWINVSCHSSNTVSKVYTAFTYQEFNQISQPHVSVFETHLQWTMHYLQICTSISWTLCTQLKINTIITV